MERANAQHSPRVDDAMARETDSMTKGAPVEGRAEEWPEQEGPGDSEPQAQSLVQPLADDRPSPGALPRDEVDRRSELARSLRPSAFPGNRGALLEVAEAEHASEWVLHLLRELQPEREYANVQDVWSAAGGHRETAD